MLLIPSVKQELLNLIEQLPANSLSNRGKIFG
ncbi:hypothetical protein NO976_01760 [Planktothrix agardhii]|jgi:hypothetical protein|nr:hypothetical protein NIES204_30030 [Planktothrix agardhii NIES-204]CAD5934734.1 hypothetical protein NIVACYA_01976 [Planktothrix agardhii]CAD5937542.1 hypothetical protein NO976_01760 [Planktothrix agardhii]CAD5956752.1 hypothetical protein NO365_02924 [Planktothrix agardhii]